jgi:integrase
LKFDKKHREILAAVRTVASAGPRLGPERAGIGTHDLRRTLATRLGDMSVADEVIERILNHAPRTVAAKHYNHAKHFEPMRLALEAWSERIEAIIEGREPVSNVLPLRSVGGTA